MLPIWKTTFTHDDVVAAIADTLRSVKGETLVQAYNDFVANGWIAEIRYIGDSLYEECKEG